MPHSLSSIPATWAGDLSVVGADVSAVLRCKVLSQVIPTVPTAAGTTEILFIVPFTGTITDVRVTFKDALTTSDTNFVTFNLINKGQAGAGSANVLATSPAGVNTTKATGGVAEGAYTTRILTVNAANVAVVQGDTLAFQVVGTGTLANTLTEGRAQICFDVLI